MKEDKSIYSGIGIVLKGKAANMYEIGAMLKMRYVYLIALFAIGSIITSCNSWSKGKFEITNHTSRVIDSIYILPDQSFGRNYINLKPNETKYYVTNMDGEGTDGSYVLFYKSDAATGLNQFGYYSNGAFMEKITKIDIQSDTVLFKFIY